MSDKEEHIHTAPVDNSQQEFMEENTRKWQEAADKLKVALKEKREKEDTIFKWVMRMFGINMSIDEENDDTTS